MTDDAQAENAPQFAIQRIYVKDLSFESPNAPQIFLEDGAPEIQVGLQTEVTALGDETYEVVLTVNVEARLAERTIYLLEVQQAGIFLARNFPEDQLGPLLGIGAPNALLPYARELISDLTTRGTFAPFILQPVNFEAMYAQQQADAPTDEAATH